MDVFQKIVDFIVNNWSYISVGLVVIVNVLIILIKKRPVVLTDSLKQSILQLLPGIILGAEAIVGSKHGAEKMDIVVETIEKWFDKNGFEFTDTYKQFVIESTENIIKCGIDWITQCDVFSVTFWSVFTN